MRHLLRFLVILTACKPTPAQIELSDLPTGPIVSLDLIPLPKIVIRDAQGQIIQPPYAVVAGPPRVLAIQDDHLLPLGNGDGYLRVTSGPVVVQHPLQIRLIDRVELTCPRNPCTFGIGDDIFLGARALSEGKVVDIALSWGVEPSGLLEKIGPGRFQAKAPGKARVTVKSGPFSATRDLQISAPVDEVSLHCPPIFLWTAPDQKPICTLRQGKEMVLEVRAWGLGKPVANPSYQLTSAAPDIARVEGNGNIFGAGVGSTEITVHSGGAAASLSLEVLPNCLAEKTAVTFSLPYKRGQPTQRLNLWCRSFQPKTCVERAIQVYGGPSNEALEACCCVHRPRY